MTTPPPAGRVYFWRVGAGLLLLFALLAAALVFYASTGRFSRFVRAKLVNVLEDATGGRVELQQFHFNLWHLAVEVDGLTIHGLEGPGEQPYAHVDRIYVRAKILSFFSAKLGLSYLEADRPSFHLIVYPDGSTNQPRPRSTEVSNDSPIRTVFDLEADRVEVHDGLAIFNHRAMPFSVAANHMGAVITYAPGTASYLGDFTCADITAQQAKGPIVRSRLYITAEAGNHQIDLKSLRFLSNESHLDASGSLTHLANPQWNFSAQGTVELNIISALGLTGGLERGTADLALHGQGVGSSQFAIYGKAEVHNGTYHIPYVLVEGANGTANIHITPDEISLLDVVGRPRQGGTVNATLHLLHWLTPKPDMPKPDMKISARIHSVALSTVMYTVVDPGYRDLGFDTLGEGPVEIDWTGDGSDLTVAARLTMVAPAHSRRGELPLRGSVDAKYFQNLGLVRIQALAAQTPATTLNVSGNLGVYPLNRPSKIAVHMVNDDLGEFDRVLRTLDLGVNGRKGIGGVPISLQGNASFDGQGSGSLIDPAFQGHLTAGHFSTLLTRPATVRRPASSTTLSWDTLDGTGSYSSNLISVEQATLTRGHTVIHGSGQLEAHRINRRRAAFDDQSGIQGQIAISNASLTDLLAIAGQDLPVTGTVNFDAHAGGSLGDLSGGGSLTLQGGAIAGQPYHNLTARLNLAHQDIQLTQLTLLQDGGTVAGNGNYNLKTGQFLGNLDGSNFELAHFPQYKDPRLGVSGALKFDAHASGTLDTLSVLGGVHLRNLVLGGQPAGAMEVFAHTEGGTVFFTAQNSLISAGLTIKGQTQLQGEFPTEAEATLTRLNIAPFLRVLRVQTVTGNSSIGGTLHLSGPLKLPGQLNGDAEINQFAVTLQNIPLAAQSPLRATLRAGLLTVTQAHITGPETDLSLSGTGALTGDRALQMTGNGSMNMKLAQTFDPDILSSGHVDFNVDADGTLDHPEFSGRLHVANVAVALKDLPNGVSQLNGNLVFDKNRLQVQELTGMTGGGQLKFGGYLAYQQGIYGDFTATGKDVRVRYRGISATADTSLHLQGSPTNMLFSGSVQVTRFIIGANVDFASFAPSATASIPPDPNAPSSHVRLDVHILSAPQLDFQNSYAQLAGSVDLHIRGTVAQPSILGRINITDGTANFAGTTYQLQHGEIHFANPVMIQPLIDIDATTRVEEYDVTIGLHGTTNQLTPTFRSEPPLPQADVISLLALGRTQEEQALYAQQEQSVSSDSTSNALLGGALNAAVGSRVQKLFGGGSVKIDPTYVGTVGNSSARITVQQNIARNVQVTYATNVNATAQQLIQAQVNVTGNVSVLAVRDEAGVFSLVLKVRRRYR